MKTTLINAQGLSTEDYYDHFVRTQDYVTSAVTEVLDVCETMGEEISDHVQSVLGPLLDLADLVDMKPPEPVPASALLRVDDARAQVYDLIDIFFINGSLHECGDDMLSTLISIHRDLGGKDKDLCFDAREFIEDELRR